MHQPESIALIKIHTAQQEISTLQEQFDSMENGELKWGLEEDIIGKVKLI